MKFLHNKKQKNEAIYDDTKSLCQLHLNWEDIEDLLVVNFEGKFDDQCGHINTDLENMIKDRKKILFDCTNLNHINSGGMRIFLKSLKFAKSQQSRLSVCGLSSSIVEIFKITGFNKLFNLYPTREDALDSLKRI